MSREELIHLARVALWAAVGNQWEKASQALQAIGDHFGGDGVVTAMLAWCDTAIAQVPGWDYNKGGRVGMTFLEETKGTVDYTGETVPPGVRWAGMLIAARAADDEKAFRELLDSCRDDRQFSENVADLLKMIATNLRPVHEAAQQVKASRGPKEGGAQ